MFRKNKLAMIVGEFLGTGALALTVLSLSHSTLGQLPFFIAASAGLLLSVMVVALAGITGAVFNPALTIGLWTVRKIQTLQAVAYILAQLAGGAVAWVLFAYFAKTSILDYPFNWKYSAPVLVAEVVGTFVFSFAVAAAIYQRLHLGLKAFMIGAGLTVGALIATLGSIGVLNPAVALALHQFGWGTYVLGPILGSVLGFNLYNLLFVETEVAEASEARAEGKTAKLDSALSQSVVAQEYDAKAKVASDKVKVSGAKARATTSSKVVSKKAATVKKKKPAKK